MILVHTLICQFENEIRCSSGTNMHTFSVTSSFFPKWSHTFCQMWDFFPPIFTGEKRLWCFQLLQSLRVSDRTFSTDSLARAESCEGKNRLPVSADKYAPLPLRSRAVYLIDLVIYFRTESPQCLLNAAPAVGGSQSGFFGFVGDGQNLGLLGFNRKKGKIGGLEKP